MEIDALNAIYQEQKKTNELLEKMVNGTASEPKKPMGKPKQKKEEGQLSFE